MSSDDALSRNTSSSSDFESRQAVGEEKGSPIKANLLNCRDVAEEDEVTKMVKLSSGLSVRTVNP